MKQMKAYYRKIQDKPKKKKVERKKRNMEQTEGPKKYFLFF